MTYDTYDDLSKAAGKKMSNKLWRKLICDEFNVSILVASEMLRAMYKTKDKKIEVNR